jgi:hypothetical protein
MLTQQHKDQEEKLMKKRIWNLIAIILMTAAIAFSVIQLRTPVVKASGCPTGVMWDCTFCNLTEETVMYVGDQIIRTCYYWCTGCPGPGGEPMEIEHVLELYE